MGKGFARVRNSFPEQRGAKRLRGTEAAEKRQEENWRDRGGR